MDTICASSCWRAPRWDDRNLWQGSNVHRQCGQVSKMIRFNAFTVSSVEGIVFNLNNQEVAVDQACCQRVVLFVVEIESTDKYQMHK